MESSRVRVVYNGERCEVVAGTTVAELLEQLSLEPKFVAVEVNYQLVPRRQHMEHELRDGDRLEVVTLVGGG